MEPKADCYWTQSKKSPKSVKKGTPHLKIEHTELDIVKKEQTSDFYTEGRYILQQQSPSKKYVRIIATAKGSEREFKKAYNLSMSTTFGQFANDYCGKLNIDPEGVHLSLDDDLRTPLHFESSPNDVGWEPFEEHIVWIEPKESVEQTVPIPATSVAIPKEIGGPPPKRQRKPRRVDSSPQYMSAQSTVKVGAWPIPVPKTTRSGRTPKPVKPFEPS